MDKIIIGSLLTVLGVFALTPPASGHVIAGNRFFPGTLTFDDPSVGDEFSMTGNTLPNATDRADVTDYGASLSFVRLLTPTLSFGVDTGILHRDWGPVQSSGASGTDLTLKGSVYRNDPNETLIAAALTYGVGGSGAKHVDANAPPPLQPSLTFGQGFGALPESAAWLRPFAITGSMTYEIPIHGSAENVDYDSTRGQFVT